MAKTDALDFRWLEKFYTKMGGERERGEDRKNYLIEKSCWMADESRTTVQ